MYRHPNGLCRLNSPHLSGPLAYQLRLIPLRVVVQCIVHRVDAAAKALRYLLLVLRRKAQVLLLLWYFGHIQIFLLSSLCIFNSFCTMAKSEKTSPRVSTIASALLRNPKSPKKVKTVAASALTQTADKKKAK